MNVFVVTRDEGELSVLLFLDSSNISRLSILVKRILVLLLGHRYYRLQVRSIISMLRVKCSTRERRVHVKHDTSVILNTGGYGKEINTGLLCVFC